MVCRQRGRCSNRSRIGRVGLKGKRILTPTQTTNFTLLAKGPGGEVSRSATVEVLVPTPTPAPAAARVPAPVVVSFDAAPSQIREGGSALLAWSASNAIGVRIDPGLGSQPPAGSVRVSPARTITYTLTATGAGGETSRSTSVQVTPAPPPAVITFSASPSSISQGETALLQWSVSNATGVRIDPGLGARAETGNFRVNPAETTTYTLVAASAGGETRRTVRVEVVALTAGTTKVNPKDGLKYVWIPPGRFTMGCSPGDAECANNEKPAHEVNITKGFWMGQTEVTQEAYEKVTGKDPSHFKGAKLPVESITWNEAQSLCQMAGMRLRAEAEWEYAAQAGSTQGRYGDLVAISWNSGNSGNMTHEVAQKVANAWGLYDTLGNVYEWTSDWYADKLPGAVNDPAGPASGQARVVRGARPTSIPGSSAPRSATGSSPGFGTTISGSGAWGNCVKSLALCV